MQQKLLPLKNQKRNRILFTIILFSSFCNYCSSQVDFVEGKKSVEIKKIISNNYFVYCINSKSYPLKYLWNGQFASKNVSDWKQHLLNGSYFHSEIDTVKLPFLNLPVTYRTTINHTTFFNNKSVFSSGYSDVKIPVNAIFYLFWNDSLNVVLFLSGNFTTSDFLRYIDGYNIESLDKSLKKYLKIRMWYVDSAAQVKKIFRFQNRYYYRISYKDKSNQKKNLLVYIRPFEKTHRTTLSDLKKVMTLKGEIKL